jgi:DNA-binding transcriptional MerR regulator
MDSFLTIDEAAQRTGLTAHTLRYYERCGLLGPVPRAPGGQRRYTPRDLEWIGFLLRLRATGMPIRRMQEYARLRGEGDATLAERRQMLEAHHAELLRTMEELQANATALPAKIAHYRAQEHALSPVKPTARKAKKS